MFELKTLLYLRESALFISVLCFIIQITLYLNRAAFRNVNQKILLGTTITHTVSALIQFSYIFAMNSFDLPTPKVFSYFITVVFTVFNAALLSWQCVFMKSLYDQFVIQLITDKWNFRRTFFCWVAFFLTLPCAILSAISYYYKKNLIFILGMIYQGTRCSFILLNVLCLCRVLCVIVFNRRSNVTGRVYVAVVLTLLLNISTGLEEWTAFWNILLEKYVTYKFHKTGLFIHNYMYNINAFQVSIITIVFLILRFKSRNKSIMRMYQM